MLFSLITIITTIFNLALLMVGGYLIFRFLILGIGYFKSHTNSYAERDVLRKSLSENLKERRIRNNMTQEFVAEHLGVSRQAVSKWENGNAEPSTSNLIAIARLYNIPARDLLPKD